MSTYIGYRDGGKTNEEGLKRELLQVLDSGVAMAKSSTSLAVSQRGAGANMSVDVAVGDAHLALTNYSYWGWIDAIENVVISASDPSNPRIDVIVSFVDLAVIDDTLSNNVGALKFKSVTGTAAGSPVAPDSTAIQSSVGAGNPYVILANVAVAAGATTISDANITDMRTAVALRVPLSSTNTIALENIPDGLITSAKLNTEIAGSYDSWSPSYTSIVVNNGTATARYKKTGRQIVGEYHLTCGSTTALANTQLITTPVTLATRYASQYQVVGTVIFRDNSTGDIFPGVAVVDNSTTTMRLLYEDTATGKLTTAFPVAEGAADNLSVTFKFEAAS